MLIVVGAVRGFLFVLGVSGSFHVAARKFQPLPVDCLGQGLTLEVILGGFDI